MTNEERDKTIEQLERIQKNLGSIGETVDYLDFAIEALEQQPSEDCRNCKKWNECTCGKEGHENGTSIGYSIGECKDYEPSEDYISRQAAINTAIDAADDWDGGCDAYREEMIREALEALPPVTPQPKTGHWIYTSKRRLIDETDEGCVYITDYRCTCSECGGDFGFQKMSDAYCKYCGAKMEVGE